MKRVILFLATFLCLASNLWAQPWVATVNADASLPCDINIRIDWREPGSTPPCNFAHSNGNFSISPGNSHDDEYSIMTGTYEPVLTVSLPGCPGNSTQVSIPSNCLSLPTSDNFAITSCPTCGTGTIKVSFSGGTGSGASPYIFDVTP